MSDYNRGMMVGALCVTLGMGLRLVFDWIWG